MYDNGASSAGGSGLALTLFGSQYGWPIVISIGILLLLIGGGLGVAAMRVRRGRGN